jgi:hypothetical protein
MTLKRFLMLLAGVCCLASWVAAQENPRKRQRPEAIPPAAFHQYNIRLIRAGELVEIVTDIGNVVYIYRDTDGNLQMTVVPGAFQKTSELIAP